MCADMMFNESFPRWPGAASASQLTQSASAFCHCDRANATLEVTSDDQKMIVVTFGRGSLHSASMDTQ